MLGTPLNSLGYERTGNQLDPGTTMNTYATEFCATIDVGTTHWSPQSSLTQPSVQRRKHHLDHPHLRRYRRGVPLEWTRRHSINSHEITFNNVDPSLTGAYIAWVEMGIALDDAIAFDLEITGNPEINVFDVTANCLPTAAMCSWKPAR